MAQIVIFAPKGEDASAGVDALKEAGHEVEVVEATAENLLHMAIGMIGGKDEEPTEPPAPEETEEDAEPLPPEEPVEAETEENPEKMESLGTCTIDGETVTVRRGEVTRLFVKEITGGEKKVFQLGESMIATWDNKFKAAVMTVKGNRVGASIPVYRSKFDETYLEVGPELRSIF